MSNKNRNRKYTNGEITVIWQAAECIHSGICFSSLRRVFDPLKRPWVNMEGGTTDEIIDIVERCPSQALTFFWNDDNHNVAATSPKIFRGDLSRLFPVQHEEPSATPAVQQPATRVTYREGGPMIIEGSFRLILPDGSEYKKMEMISVCRCGESRNQPFCDGSHFKIGFNK